MSYILSQSVILLFIIILAQTSSAVSAFATHIKPYKASKNFKETSKLVG